MSSSQKVKGVPTFIIRFLACFFTVIWIILLHYFLFASKTWVEVDRPLTYYSSQCNNGFENIIFFALPTHEAIIIQQLSLNCLQSLKFKTARINPWSIHTRSQVLNFFIIRFVPIFQLLVLFLAFWLNFNISVITEANRFSTLIVSNSSSSDSYHVSFMNVKLKSLITPDCTLYLDATVIDDMKISSVSFFAILSRNKFSWWLDLAYDSNQIKNYNVWIFYLS